MVKKTDGDVQTSAQTTDDAAAAAKAKADQDAAKAKLVADGIDDPSHLEILTDQFAGQGGSYSLDPATGIRTRID